MIRFCGQNYSILRRKLFDFEVKMIRSLNPGMSGWGLNTNVTVQLIYVYFDVIYSKNIIPFAHFSRVLVPSSRRKW